MLYCAICVFVPDSSYVAKEVITIIRGYAVCEDHIGLVAQGLEWSRIITITREQWNKNGIPPREHFEEEVIEEKYCVENELPPRET